MYSYIRGVLTEKNEDGVVVDCHGLGFDLQMGPQLAARRGEIGTELTVYTHFHITQDSQKLYAFPDKESRKLFRMLISVSGIGPKVAMSVLEDFEPAEFALHVLKKDTKALTKVKGLGKKSAERIIVDLKDKLSKSRWAEEAVKSRTEEAPEETPLDDAARTMQDEVLEGLAYLGYQPAEAGRLLKQSFDPEADLETNLKRALASGRQV